MALRDASIVWKIIICIQVAALIVCLVGFGTNYLVYFENRVGSIHGGLWEIYSNDKTVETDDYLELADLSSEWLEASKTMMSLSVGLHIISTALTVGSAFITTSPMVSWALAVGEFASAISGLIGCSVAVAKIKSVLEDATQVTFSIGYSFILFLITQFVFAGCGLLLLLDARLKITGRPQNTAPAAKIATIF
ncbi:hypothetical protein BsWGS_24215 [Bradybaena similaris]